MVCRNHEWTFDEVPGTFYEMSGKGWIDQELFKRTLGGWESHLCSYYKAVQEKSSSHAHSVSLQAGQNSCQFIVY